MGAFATLRNRARELKVELIALALAARHPDTPWYARLIVAGCVAYAVTPVDLIPDAIPIVGFSDDLIFIPLAVRFIPAPVMADCRDRAYRALDRRLERERVRQVAHVLPHAGQRLEAEALRDELEDRRRV